MRVKKCGGLREFMQESVRRFGFDSLNKHQEEALRFVFDSKSGVFGNLPTGFGKSVVFQALLTLPTQEKNIVLVSPSQPLNFTWNKRYITQ